MHRNLFCQSMYIYYVDKDYKIQFKFYFLFHSWGVCLYIWLVEDIEIVKCGTFFKGSNNYIWVVL